MDLKPDYSISDASYDFGFGAKRLKDSGVPVSKPVALMSDAAYDLR